MIMPKPGAHLQTRRKGPTKFQTDWYKTIGGAVHTRYPQKNMCLLIFHADAIYKISGS